jgi:hypothetical protein
MELIMPVSKKTAQPPSDGWKKQERHGVTLWIKTTAKGGREFRVTISNQPLSGKGPWLAQWVGPASAVKDKPEISQRRFWTLSAAETSMETEIQERLRSPKRA